MKQIVAIILFMVGSFPVLSQTITPDLITASGDFYKTSTGSLSWTIGEPITETFLGSNSVLTQGVQQSKWVVTPSGIEDEQLGSYKIYPNPTRDNLYVELLPDQVFNVSLYDINGRLLLTRDGFNTTGKVSLSGMKESLLILRVYILNTKKTINFKIVKTK